MPDEFVDKSFLIVDDFADMRSAIISILRALGVTRIHQARDGEDAIAKLSSARYDVVLCDYNLGRGKDGQQVLEEARHRHLIGVDTVFIMITAENTREMVMAAVEHAPDTYLAKPFTRELLRNRLDKLFALKANLATVNKALLAKSYGAAIKELDRLIAAGPKNLSELVKTKAEVLLTAKRYDEARTIFEEVLAKRAIGWAELGLGKVYFGQGQYAQAQEVFDQLVSKDPNMVAAFDWLAKAQVALQNFRGAEQTLATAALVSPRGLARQQTLGELALTNGNAGDAEKAFERAVALAKHSVLNHPSLFAGLASSKSANGKHDDALKVVGDLRKAFAGGEEAAIYAASTEAAVKTSQGDEAGAAAALAAAEEVMSKMDDHLQSSSLMLQMAKTYAQVGAQDKAAEMLHKAIANNHDQDELLMEIVQVCQAADLDYDAETAIREIRKSVVGTNNEGVRLIKQGEMDAAIRLLAEAADEMPGNRTINLNAAKAIIMKMEKLGATSEDVLAVRRYVERVQGFAPNDWRLSDILSRLRTLATQAS